MDIKEVVKRDGSVVAFDVGKIAEAIDKAMHDAYDSTIKESEMKARSEEYARAVLEKLKEAGTEKQHVEQIQDIVEQVLMEKEAKVAKAYIIYRNKRTELRAYKTSLGLQDDLKMPLNSLIVLAARYLLKDENGKVIETPKQLFRRVAHTMASVDKKYNISDERVSAFEEEVYNAMVAFDFMPNSPTLMNAGADLGQLSACFVLPVEDSIDGIFDAVKWTAMIHKSGGGTGFAFSRLRPTGDIVKKTGGVASGPVSFMKVFDAATEEIKQGGKRRGANMGILRVDHPDILNFIVAKDMEGILQNFNISVAVTDKFMAALQKGGSYELYNPRSERSGGTLNARAVWDLIVTSAWKTGDPGVVFLDRMNSTVSNPVPKLGPIESTNPCVTGDTLISTSAGTFRAELLYNSGKELDVKVDGRFGGGFMRSSSVIMTGIKPVVKVRTKEGFEIRVTRDHKIYSEKNGWTEVAQLERGEKIRILDEGGAFGTSGNVEEGRTLGWLVGDGHINHGIANKRAVLSFYGNDVELSGMFENYVNDIVRQPLNGREYHTGSVHVDSRGMVSIASERLKEYAAQQGLDEIKLRIPERVFSGTKEMQRGFIQALFEADGTVNVSSRSRYSVRLASISEKLLREVQMLLLNFRIYSRIYYNRKPSGKKMMPDAERKPKEYAVQAYHDLVITRGSLVRFAEEVGFLSDMKNSKLMSTLGAYTRGPYEEDWTATISSVEEDGTAAVYDLTEPVTHSFVANGIVVHNCGEQPLYPFDSCNLGSINLAKMLKTDDERYEIDWEKLRAITRMGVRFLDNVIDANKYPIPQIDKMTKSIRRIGLGIMGWADMLIKLGIRYDSNEALLLAEKVMKFIETEGRKMSQELAEEKGAFPEFENSVWKKFGSKPLRNSTVTTIAPTGTISIIAGGTSSGIEPLFSVVYMRNVRYSLGSNLIEVNNTFEEFAMKYGFYDEALMKKLAGKTSVQDVEEIPEAIRRLFVTAFDINPEWHVKMQAAFQKYVDNAVSKTINFPNTATPQDVETAYLMAYKLGCKGITIYRDRSKKMQILTEVDTEKAKSTLSNLAKQHQDEADKVEQLVTVSGLVEEAKHFELDEFKNTLCPECHSTMIVGEGCATCPNCGYSKCG